VNPATIRYGEGHLEVPLPPDREVETLATGGAGEPRPVEDAIAPLLPEIAAEARGAELVAILVPDDSRPFPADRVLPELLRELTAVGIADDAIRIVVATGLHRAMPDDALERHLGTEAMRRVAVRNHDARDAEDLVRLGDLVAGVPLLLAREAVEADLRILLGSYEPHQYHGFSGGFKVLGIGCAGEATIAYTHGRAFLEDERVRPGASPDNPFRAAIVGAGRRAGRAVALTLIPGDDPATVLGAAAGDPEEVWNALLPRAMRVFGGTVEEPADIVLAGVPDPKSRSLYQASRAATNLVLTTRPAVRPGGTIVIAAPLEDGAGTGEGERRFAEALRTRGAGILDEEAPLRPGEQRAYMVARVLRDHRIVVVGAEEPAALEGLGIEFAEDAAAVIRDLPGRLLVVPDALHVIPG
jgi:nickel-dependent lactate racemase